MTWYTPKVAEVAIGLEINSYACAESLIIRLLLY